jgi:hypothetical protein
VKPNGIAAKKVKAGLGGLNVSIADVGEENGLSLHVSDAFLHEEECTSLLPLTATKVRRHSSRKMSSSR